MRQGGNAVERAIKVGEDTAFAWSGNIHAEGAAAFAVALLGIDPVVVKGALGECLQFRGKTTKMSEDEFLGLVIREDHLALTGRGKNIPPLQFLHAKTGCLGFEVLAEHGEGIFHRAHHGIKGFLVDAGGIQRAVYAVSCGHGGG